MKLIKGEFDEKLELQFANSIKAGFPSPAEDYLGEMGIDRRYAPHGVCRRLFLRIIL